MKALQKIVREPDNRVVLTVGSAVSFAFAAILLFVGAAWITGRQREETQQDFATLIGTTSEIGVLSQRIALLQFGLFQPGSAAIRDRLSDRIERELTRFSEAVTRISLASQSDVPERFTGPNTRTSIEDMLSSALAFRDTARELLKDSGTAVERRELVPRFAEQASTLLAESRHVTEELGSDAVRRATLDDRLTSLIYAVGIATILFTGLSVVSFIVNRLRRELRFRRETEQRLLHANQELERFSAMVAHDLRSPLANIAMAAKMLQSGSNAATVDKELPELIGRESSRLNRMVRALLGVSRLQTAQLGSNEIRVAELLQGVIESLKASLSSAQAKVIYDGDATIKGDRGLLHNLFQNLIENSLKYSRPDVPAEISITTAPTGDIVSVQVDDNGRGIPKDMWSSVFEPFRQGPGASKKSGVGLGLSVVKKVVAVHGGEVHIEEKEGPGTRFVVSLPAANG